MHVEFCGARFDVPDHLIQTYIKDFETLPGSGQRNAVLDLRRSMYEVIDYIFEDPEALHDFEYRSDFINALAMQKALEIHGILHDS